MDTETRTPRRTIFDMEPLVRALNNGTDGPARRRSFFVSNLSHS